MKSKSARLASRAAIVLSALIVVALVPSGALAAHHGKGKAKHHPAGAVKLPKSEVHHVKGVVCGKLHHRKWVSGSVVGGYFISDSQQAHNYSVLAKHARGKSKAADTKLAKKFGKRAKAGQKACSKAGTKSGRGKSKGPSTSAAPGAAGKPLHFNLNGAVGLALKGSSTGGATANVRRVPGATTSVAPEEASGSNLVAINEAGEVSDAVSSGSAGISRFLIAPNEQLYVIFERPVDLSNTSEHAGPGSGCILAQVDPKTGNPTCIDNSLESVGNIMTVGGVPPLNPPVQFDSSGAIYYVGYTTSNEAVLRKWSNGTSTNLIAPAHVSVREFAVLPDGTVLLSGVTLATDAEWTRRISPSGSLKSLASGMAFSISRYPDGKFYMGFDSPNVGIGFDSYEESADALDPKWWIASSEGGIVPSGGEYNSYQTFCSSSAHPTPTVEQGFCEANGLVAGNFVTDEGKDFVVSGSGQRTVAMEFYPTVSVLPTTLKSVTVAEAANDDLLLAGENSSGSQILTLFDTSTEEETQLLGPPVTSDEYEIYDLSYVADGNKILFDGLQFSNDQYVIGEYDLSTHTLSVDAAATSKWSELQSF